MLKQRNRGVATRSWDPSRIEKKGDLDRDTPLGPWRAASMIGSSQKDGTVTSPTAQIIFAYMYVTHTTTVAVYGMVCRLDTTCELAQRLARS